MSDLDGLIERIRRLEEDVTRLSEREHVRDVYVRYGRAVDRLDYELYETVFWSDAQINYGTAESITSDQHWSAHMLQGHRDRLVAWGHLLTNEAIDIDGDVAHVEIYVTPMWVPKEKDGSGDTFLAGRYIDRLDRRNGEWRISVREFLPHFAMRVDTSNYESLLDHFDKSGECARIRQPWGKGDTSNVRPLTRRPTKEEGPPSAT